MDKNQKKKSAQKPKEDQKQTEAVSSSTETKVYRVRTMTGLRMVLKRFTKLQKEGELCTHVLKKEEVLSGSSSENVTSSSVAESSKVSSGNPSGSSGEISAPSSTKSCENSSPDCPDASKVSSTSPRSARTSGLNSNPGDGSSHSTWEFNLGTPLQKRLVIPVCNLGSQSDDSDDFNEGEGEGQ